MSKSKAASALLVVATLALGGHASAGPAGAEPESLRSWQWFAQATLPAGTNSKYVDFLVPPAVFDKARDDLADVRIFDAQDREVPYALRIRRPRMEEDTLPARKFNQTSHADRSVEVSLDLGKSPAEHNALDIQSPGENVRRRVRVEGSDTAKTWSTLVDNSYLVHFTIDGQHVDVHRVSYSASRFRYLRVTLFPDRGLENDRPTLGEVTVLRDIEIPGEFWTGLAKLGPREPVKANGGAPGSAWTIRFDGYAVPCDRLSFDISDKDFSRAYALEGDDGNGHRRMLASGTWVRRAGTPPVPMIIDFSEVQLRQLRLVITDFRNPPLNIETVHYRAPGRQIIFGAGAPGPVRVYFGNPEATAPHYDLAAQLPATLQPTRITLSAVEANPVYQPTPKPLTERWPWLIYVVLSLASAVLLVILLALARRALPREPEATPSGTR